MQASKVSFKVPTTLLSLLKPTHRAEQYTLTIKGTQYHAYLTASKLGSSFYACTLVNGSDEAKQRTDELTERGVASVVVSQQSSDVGLDSRQKG